MDALLCLLRDTREVLVREAKISLRDVRARLFWRLVQERGHPAQEHVQYHSYAPTIKVKTFLQSIKPSTVPLLCSKNWTPEADARNNLMAHSHYTETDSDPCPGMTSIPKMQQTFSNEVLSLFV